MLPLASLLAPWAVRSIAFHCASWQFAQTGATGPVSSRLRLREGRRGQEHREDRQDPGRGDEGLDSHVNPFLSFDLPPVQCPAFKVRGQVPPFALRGERSRANAVRILNLARNAFRYADCRFVCFFLSRLPVLRAVPFRAQ